MDYGEDIFSEPIVDTMLAANYLAIDEVLITEVTKLVAVTCETKGFNPLNMYKLLRNAGSQTSFKSLAQVLEEYA
eukprot:scaffold295377_cov20-Prasinocladus_malaysianus.AAC.1